MVGVCERVLGVRVVSVSEGWSVCGVLCVCGVFVYLYVCVWCLCGVGLCV